MTLLSMAGWDTLPFGSGVTGAQGGRPGKAIYVHANYSPGTPGIWGASLAVADQHDTVILGAFIRHPNSPGTMPLELLQFYNLAGGIHVKVRWNYGYLDVLGPGGTMLGNTVGGSWGYGVARFLEVKVHIHPSAGSVTIHLDQVEVLNITGVNTQLGASDLIAMVFMNVHAYISYGVQGGCTIVDDVYLCNGAGSRNNDFLGDCHVAAFLADGNGAHSDWVGSDGNSSDNYALLNPTTDTGYVETSTPGAIDTYTFEDAAGTDVFGVAVTATAYKTESLINRTMATMVRNGAGSDAEGAVVDLATSTTWVQGFFETQIGGAPWSIAALNDSEFGIKLIS